MNFIGRMMHMNMLKRPYSFCQSWLCMLAACFVAIGFASCKHKVQQKGEEAAAPDTTRRITLLFAGDLMQHITQINAACTADGGYNYDSYFESLQEYISSFDLALANLEVTLGGKPYTGYPTFSAPDEYLTAIRSAGFDVLTTANNHCCDRGRRGVERTIHMLDSLGISHLGTYSDSLSRAQSFPLIVEKNGFRIALLNYTYGTNGIPVPKPNCVNLIDRAQMALDIKRAQGMKPDVIIAVMHWGIEYAMVPNAEQRELADWLFAQGVDHVIGGHPHVVQPVEVRTDAKGGRHVLAYSLGNFISNQMMENSDGGMMVSLTLEKDSTVRLADCDYSLCWVSRPVVSHKKNHRLLPVGYPDSLLNAEERRLMGRFATNARRLFEKHNQGDIREHALY